MQSVCGQSFRSESDSPQSRIGRTDFVFQQFPNRQGIRQARPVRRHGHAGVAAARALLCIETRQSSITPSIRQSSAFASFTLGARGAKGACHGTWRSRRTRMSLSRLKRRMARAFAAFAFFDHTEDESKRFDVTSAGGSGEFAFRPLQPVKSARELSPQKDTWRAGDLVFSIHHAGLFRSASVRFTGRTNACLRASHHCRTHSRQSKEGRRRAHRLRVSGQRSLLLHAAVLRPGPDQPIKGVAHGRTAIASADHGVHLRAGVHGQADPRGAEKRPRCLRSSADVGLLIGTVPARSRKTFRFCDLLSSERRRDDRDERQYYYTRFFSDIEEVADFALKNFSALKNRGADLERRFQKST